MGLYEICHKLLDRSVSIDNDGDFMVFSVNYFKLIDSYAFYLFMANLRNCSSDQQQKFYCLRTQYLQPFVGSIIV